MFGLALKFRVAIHRPCEVIQNKYSNPNIENDQVNNDRPKWLMYQKPIKVDNRKQTFRML